MVETLTEQWQGRKAGGQEGRKEGMEGGKDGREGWKERR
jgi:hypothetical protein